MDFSEINSILNNLSNLRNSRKKISSYKDDEDSETSFEIYSTSLEDDRGNEVFVKIEIYLGSYSECEEIRGIEFVKERQKTVTNFEAL